MSGIISDTEEDGLTGERAGAEQDLTEVKMVVWTGSNRAYVRQCLGERKVSGPAQQGCNGSTAGISEFGCECIASEAFWES